MQNRRRVVIARIVTIVGLTLTFLRKLQRNESDRAVGKGQNAWRSSWECENRSNKPNEMRLAYQIAGSR